MRSALEQALVAPVDALQRAYNTSQEVWATGKSDGFPEALASLRTAMENYDQAVAHVRVHAKAKAKGKAAAKSAKAKAAK